MRRQNKAMTPIIMRQGSGGLTKGRTALAVVLIWLAGLAVSTQFLAATLHYQSALGPHWNLIYWPWRIIQWSMAWFGTHPHLIIGGGSAGVTLCAFLLILLTLRKTLAANTAVVNEYMHGSARWATREDIEKAGLFSEDGVYVGGWEDELLSVAPTRSGKTISLVVPTLLSWMHSCVISDLKGELWELTAGWRKEYGNSTVLRFEPASTMGSIHWNPLEEIRLDTEYETGDVQNLATMIVDPDGKGVCDHWQKTSQALLVGCILHVLYKKRNGDAEEASLPAVDALLADPARPLADLWAEMVSYPHKDGAPLDTVARSAQDMIARPEEEAGSVLSTAKLYLALYRDGVVAANVRESSFRVRDLMNRDKPISLYIVIQPEDKERLRPLVCILINMICRLLAGKMDFAETPIIIFDNDSGLRPQAETRRMPPTQK